MSLLDDLAKDSIDYSHNCLVPTKYGQKSRKESYLFAYQEDKHKVYNCICGRRFKAVGSAGGYVMWKERN